MSEVEPGTQADDLIAHGSTGDERPSRIDRVVRSYTDRWGVVATLTLAGLLLVPPVGAPRATAILVVVGLLGLVWLRQDWRFWGALTIVTAIGVLRHPLLDLDNHHLLGLYWLAALTLACLSSDPLATLRRAARWLVGLVFLFATIWKLLVPDFADGSVLTYLLVADGNAAEMLRVAGLQDADVLEANRALIAEQKAVGGEPRPVELQVSSAAARLGPVLAVLTIIVEAAVALAFLLPLRGRWRWLRELGLYAFVFATYPLVPVVGFGWLLLTMGLASTSLESHRATVVYLFAFCAVGALGARGALLELVGLV